MLKKFSPRVIFGVIGFMAFGFIFGPNLYAEFFRMTGAPGWSYGYGYGYGYGAGYDRGLYGYRMEGDRLPGYGYGYGYGYKYGENGGGQDSGGGVFALSGGGPVHGQMNVPDQAVIDINSSHALGEPTGPDPVTLFACEGGRSATECPSTTGLNLCTRILVTNNGTKLTCEHEPLAANTTFRFRINSSVVVNTNGERLSSDVIRVFQTGGTSSSNNTTPPLVFATIPSAGNNFPANGNLTVQFPIGPEGNMKFNSGPGSVAQAGDLNFCTDGNCAVSLKKFVNSVPTTEVCTSASACTFTWDSNQRTFTIDPSTSLDTSNSGPQTEYQLCVRGGANALAVKNSSNVSMTTDFCTQFKTMATDNTAPTIGNSSANSGTTPADGATNITPFAQELIVRFSEKLDPTTVSLSTVRLCEDMTANTSGCESRDPRLTDPTKFFVLFHSSDNTVRLSPVSDDSLSENTKYCFEVIGGSSGVKDLAGNAFAGTTSGNCFTTGTASDLVPGSPQLLFTEGDNFKIVAKFTEPMIQGDLVSSGTVNTSNVTLQCPANVPVSLSGKAALYRSDTRELEIQGLGLPIAQRCILGVTNARDLAGNAIETTPAAVAGGIFTVLDSTTTQGILGSNAASTDFFGGTAGDTAATFWERPKRAEPVNRIASKLTKVEVEFPAPGTMPEGSVILLTFPAGFTLSDNGQPARLIASTQSVWNRDLNGPEASTITGSVSVNTDARTISLTTAGGSISTEQMVRFELDRITNPSTPLSGLSIMIVVKDSNGLKIGKTINPAPFTIEQGGSLSISGRVCKSTNAGGTCVVGDTPISSVKVACDQIGGFVVGQTTATVAGHQETTTNESGQWSITQLSPGQYNCFLPPDPTALADTAGNLPAQSIQLTSSSKSGIDFRLKDVSGASGKTLTVTITGGPASETVDVFCSAGASNVEFAAPTMKVVTLDGNGSGLVNLQLQQGLTYDCGVGPHIPTAQFSSGGPPALPIFTFMPPKNQQVLMSENKSLTFAIVSANRTITGYVLDGNGTGIANVFVHADPVGCFDATTGDVKDCAGAFAQTKSDGSYRLAVAAGTYEVSADAPGLPSSTRETVNARSGDVDRVQLKMVKSSTTISGAIKDESGSGIKYAHVNAERRTLNGGSDACDYSESTPAGGRADSPTDSNGNYTLYVGSGTWCVRAFSPTYGEVGTKTVVISGSSLTGQDISASQGSYGQISGTVRKAGEPLPGAFVNCFGSTGGNHAQTNSEGTYSMKVKLNGESSTVFTCDGFAHGVGPLGRATVTIASGGSSQTQDFTVLGNPGTITVTATGLTEGFCDARDSSGLGSGGQIQNGTATINVPAGTYTLRCGTKRTGPLTLTPSSLTIAAGATSSVTATVPTLRIVSGRVTDGSNNLEGATVTLTHATTKASFSVVTGSQGGTSNNFSATNVPEGSYTLRVTKKGYEPASSTVSVSGGNATLSTPIALTQASGNAGTDVTFAVQVDGSAYTGKSKVVCLKSLSVSVADTDQTTGNAVVSLTNGTWSCKAAGDNGKESVSASVTVTSGALVGANPTLSLTSAIAGFASVSQSETLSLSSGGLLKFEDLAIDGKVPEINIPASALSTSDSSTGKVDMQTDSTLADIDPGEDQNVVGSVGYDITPKDASGNKITDTNSLVTITIPYTDADVVAAGVEESKLTIARYNTSTQAWENLPTTVDAVNNLLIATTDHFSSFGILGGVAASGEQGGNNNGGTGSVSSGTSTPLPEKATDALSTEPVKKEEETKTTEEATQTKQEEGVKTPVVEKIKDLVNPSNLAELFNRFGFGSKQAEETKYRQLLTKDAGEYHLILTDSQKDAQVNFVTYGISDATIALGSDERRAILRDYFGTVGRGEVEWSDIERLTNGQKPIKRNLRNEQVRLAQVLPLFIQITGHRPDFKNKKDDLVWNTLMYRIRFPRDLEKEKQAVGQYKQLFKKHPSTPLDWAAVRAMAYGK